jgi:replicative DNA helicase
VSVPAHDLDAERAVIGAVLYSGGRLLDRLELTAEEFHHPAHAELWTLMQQMALAGEPIEAAAVLARSDRKAVHSPAIVACVELSTTAPEFYAEQLRMHAARRRIGVAAGKLGRLADPDSGERDLGELTELARTIVDEHTGTGDAQAKSRSLADTIVDGLDRWSVPDRNVLPTGWVDLDDKLTGGLRPGHLTVIGARPSVGKALALDTPLPTPTGWTTMGEISVGDHVIGMDGRTATVIAATEVMTGRPCFEVEFSDGEVIVADAQHQWLTTTRSARRAATSPVGFVYNRGSSLSRDQRWKSERPSVKTTEQIAATVRVAEGRANHGVPVTAPLDLPEADLSVDPYVLGYWLGDGTSVHADVTIADVDIPHLVAYLDAIGYHHRQRRTNTACRLGISTQPITRGGRPDRDSLRGRLRALGVLGDKHIPASYLRAGRAQRAALLAGLLDSDGTCSKSGRVAFAVTSRRLAYQVAELAASLGYVPFIGKKAVRGRRPSSSICYTVGFVAHDNPFRLPRKAERVKARSAKSKHRFIVDVRPIGSVPVRCIQVDNADHMYLAGRAMIPTHNSLMGTELAGNVAAVGAGVLFSSLEMSAAEVTDRIASSKTKVPLATLTGGLATDEQMDDLARFLTRAVDWPLEIDDRAGVGVAAIRGRARDLTRRPRGLGLVIVDYLQLVAPTDRRAPREQQVASVSRGLKLLARDLAVPVVALSQVNRGPSSRENKRPVMSDLRESGAIEADADEIWLLHRDDEQMPGELEVNVVKNRHGATGVVNLGWHPWTGRVTNITYQGERMTA